MSGDDDYQLRFQVANPGYSKDDDAIYEQAMSAIGEAVERGVAWKKIPESLSMVADAGFRQIIVDDYVKITLATRHFQNSEGLKHISKATGIPMDLLVQSKQEMLKEVEESAVAAYHLTQQAGDSTQTH